MNWIRFLLLLFLFLGFHLFQMDQAIDIDWLVCEDSLITKFKVDQPSIDLNLWFDSIPGSSSFKQSEASFQLRNPLSFLLPYFQGASPFLRSPPGV
jgi:hypothetical protein